MLLTPEERASATRSLLPPTTLEAKAALLLAIASSVVLFSEVKLSRTLEIAKIKLRRF